MQLTRPSDPVKRFFLRNTQWHSMTTSCGDYKSGSQRECLGLWLTSYEVTWLNLITSDAYKRLVWQYSLNIIHEILLGTKLLSEKNSLKSFQRKIFIINTKLDEYHHNLWSSLKTKTRPTKEIENVFECKSLENGASAEFPNANGLGHLIFKV